MIEKCASICMVIMVLLYASLLLASTITSYPTHVTTHYISPPLFFSQGSENATLGPNSTSAKLTLVLTKGLANLITNKGFEYGYAPWSYWEYNDDGSAGSGCLQGYWINSTGFINWGYIRLINSCLFTWGYYNFIWENITLITNNISQATLNYTYRAFVQAFSAELRFYIYDWNTRSAHLIHSDVLSTTPWTSASIDVTSNLTTLQPGVYAFIALLIVYLPYFEGVYVDLDDISLSIVSNDYVYANDDVLRIKCINGTYMVKLKLKSHQIVGKINQLTISFRNGRYVAYPIRVENSTVLTSETTSVIFNSSNALQHTGYIYVYVSSNVSTQATFNLELTYYTPVTSPAVTVTYPLNITIITENNSLSSTTEINSSKLEEKHQLSTSGILNNILNRLRESKLESVRYVLRSNPFSPLLNSTIAMD